MQNNGTIIEPGVLQFQRLLTGPLEKVWAYLTESEKRGKWLATGEMELREGGSVTLNFLHKDLSPIPGPPPPTPAILYLGRHLGSHLRAGEEGRQSIADPDAQEAAD